jgi:hypothetical protein
MIFSSRHAGRWRRCSGCQAPVHVPPLGKPVASAAPPTTRRGNSCWRIWAFGAVAAIVLAPGTWWLLHERERAKREDRANQVVADQVAEARVQNSRQRWDEAAALLQTALTTDKATNLDEARALLAHVRGEQATIFLRSAESALANRRPTQAASLLRRYLADPHATERDRAVQLLQQLDLVTTDGEALAILHRLSYAALADFARNGTLAELESVTHPDVRAIHLERLRSCLEREIRRREEEHARRVQSIRATPAFGELQDFVALTRRRLAAQGGREINYRLLARLFRELKVNGVDEQQRLLGKLGRRPLDYAEAEKIARMRANLKERFRTYSEFDKTDREIFGWIVDQELHRLLQDLEGPPSATPEPV